MEIAKHFKAMAVGAKKNKIRDFALEMNLVTGRLLFDLFQISI